jgi:hypothetical protein
MGAFGAVEHPGAVTTLADRSRVAARAPFLLGLDIGQVSDPTALAIAERVLTPTGESGFVDPLEGAHGRTLAERIRGIVARGGDPDRPERVEKHAVSLNVRHLERFRLGTSYVAIVEHVAARIAELPDGPRPVLVIDATGVGRPVVDLFRRAALPVTLWPVVVTGAGEATHEPGGTWHIPKTQLISALAVGLQDGSVKIARRLPEAKTLTKELSNYRYRISTHATIQFDTWRSGQHDDLLFALALTVFAAHRVERALSGGLI